MPINESPSKPVADREKKKRPQAPRGAGKNNSRPAATNNKPANAPAKHKGSQAGGLLNGWLNIKQRLLQLLPFSQKNKPQQKKTGVVKFFNRSKGFGFIQEDNGNEIYVHISGLRSRIRENDKVTYIAQAGKKGLSAIQVTVV